MTPGRPRTAQRVLWVPTNLTVALAGCSDVLSQDKAAAVPEKGETAADNEAATGPADDSEAGPAGDGQTDAAGFSG